MFGRSKHGWIGLDIGARNIKLAQMEQQGGRLRLADAAIIPRATPWRTADHIESSVRSASQELGTALITATRLRGRLAAAQLPTTACDFNTAPVVIGDDSAQVQTIAQELLTLGIHLNQRVFDYWPGLESKASNSGINVLSTSQSWSEGTVRDLRSSGLSCQAIDGLPHTLARAVAQVELNPTETIAAIDWSYTGATFVLLDNGSPVYIRQLKQTALGDTLDQFATELELDEDEATELLQSVNLAPARSEELDEISELVAEILEPTLHSMVAELQRTLSHLDNFGRQLTPKRLRLAPNRFYLFGGGATIQGIDRLLSQRVGGTFSVWSSGDDDQAMAKSKGTPLCLLASAMSLSRLCWEEESL